MTVFDRSAPLIPEIISLHGKWKASKTALIFGNERLSWQQLDHATNRIANGLIASGISRGSMVGVVMKNGRQMVEVIIGIMKAGAASVPINLSVSDDTIAVMLSDAHVKAIITTADQEHRLALFYRAHPSVLQIECHNASDDGLEIFKQQHAATKPDVALKNNDILNVIYSSGTTGQPKGIVHTHAGRRDWAYDLALSLRYNSSSISLINIGLYSNISWVSFLCTLLTGGTLVLHEAFEALYTLETIQNEHITNVSMVPIQFQRLMEAPTCPNYDLTSLQAVMSCGSPLHTDLKEILFNRFGPVIIELYGLTEGVITTLDPEDAAERMASVGKPILGTDIKLIQDNDQEAPQGQPGEIVARGRILMPGYLNQPAITAEAAWYDNEGRAWLRTGDIGTFDADGFLYIVDRKKDMIISGGQNIYPQDIEAVLIKHPLVSEVAVIGALSAKWGETPIAIIVTSPQARVSDHEIKNWANKKLGKQQRITHVIFTDVLPRNPNGKVLKKNLRAQYGEMSFD
ncbi:class I adenylate-forming enzyme family protein [Kordiimonas pumila]|uniref:Class I adenylate-forming enzyme family protein n=1 Tax=Kordiimonas pumila TaxID=2161677 RepID=A0ABV7D236_9PROT|nr:class I adenylate-forming enzyme family protein [Kordiimonas pumila]